MEITEVRVFPVAHRDERLLAFATIILEASFVVRDLRIIRGNTGLFVAMPSRKRSDGTYSDVAHPLKPELRKTIEEKVIGEYHSEMERQKEKANSEGADSSTVTAPNDHQEPQRIAV
jgi:stage V sporulation protein G